MTSILDRLIATGRTHLFVGGEWLPVSDGSTIEVVDPTTEESLATVTGGSPDDGSEDSLFGLAEFQEPSTSGRTGSPATI